MSTRSIICLLLAFTPTALAGENPLTTVAESSNFTQTSLHKDVLKYCDALTESSNLVHQQTLGKTNKGKKLPLLILSDPPIQTPAKAKRSQKPIVFILCNIHAGEVAGKEGVMMLARDLIQNKSELLKKVVLLIVPDFNADGNDEMAKENRPGQVGPSKMGLRVNAQGFDLNRDFVKLESPEVRALVKAFNEWDPHVFLDMHTTNGSRHRYTLTYDGPRHPATSEKIVNSVRDKMLPEIGEKLFKRGKFRSFYYGNFGRDLKGWETYPSLPRYGISYVGLRQRISFLSEAYSYATYKDRVLASRDFARSCIEHTAENAKSIRALLKEATTLTVEAGKKPRASSIIPLRMQTVPLPKKHNVLGYEIIQKDGRRSYTDKEKEYSLPFVGLCKPTLSVSRPYAYLIPKGHNNVIENLKRHGIVIEELREGRELNVECYRIDTVSKSVRKFQEHHLVSVEATARKEKRLIRAGTYVVRTGQPLGTLAAFLLEPQAEDGLTTWNFFDEGLKEKQDFPVVRLPQPIQLLTEKVETPTPPSQRKPITWKDLQSGKLPSFSGGRTSVTWLDDEHFLQRRSRQLFKVNARTGTGTLYLDEVKLLKFLQTISGMNRNRANIVLRLAPTSMNEKRTAFHFTHNNDLYVCQLDELKLIQLTKTPKEEESLESFSPDGKWMAYVKKNNLYVVDLATQSEKQITKDGSELIFNGRADWVYYEEIFLRRRKAYWWSPDSSQIAFLRFDDNPVPLFTVTDQIPLHQKLEKTRYPKAGDPNPLVKVGIASIKDAKVVWAKTGDYDPENLLITRVGWFPDSKRAWFYVMNRSQTWLDVMTSTADGKSTRLFRETTKAWIDNPEPLKFLKDGSFLILSERSGWKHVYHYEKDGKLRRPITDGKWEVRRIHHVDENKGLLWLSGTRDDHLGENLYRVELTNGKIERLTHEAGGHRTQVNPNGTLFVDSWSDFETPTRVALRDEKGELVRYLDTNPVRIREKYDFAKLEHVQIKAPDGFLLEATVLKPPHFDAKKKYPVWLKTYGGPHAPMVSRSWRGGRISDQALAQMGFVIFYVDPRSASGKGAESAWTAHRQLGVQELKDLETAVKWISSHSWVDGKRIGMSGGSYGGFLTAYAMTHSKIFAAGIASAPVTDWAYYDTIYTERYMGTPKDNAEGYRKTSVVKAAKNLSGRLLIVHGLMDDNVHPQNTFQFIYQLQRANKDFELMVYPRSRHGGFGSHYTKLSVDFMKRTLKP